MYSGYPKLSNLYLPERKRSWPQSSIWISDAIVWETVIFNRMIVGMGVYWHNGLPWWLSGKESAYQCRRLGFDPWIGNIPWRRKWQHSSILAWEIPWTEEPGGIQSMGLQELDTTSQLNNNILTYSSFFLLLAISLLKYFLDASSLIFMALSI